MKSYFTFFFFLVFVSSLVAQVPCPDCPPNNADQTEYDVIKIDSKMSQFNFVPGQVLVRFKDETQIVLGKTNGIVSMGIPTVDAILQKYNIKEAEKIFPLEKKKLEKKFFKTFNGLEIEVPNLHNIHKLQTDSTANIHEIIEALKQDENVVYAEPNYILSIVESEPVSPELTEAEMIEWLKENPITTPQINKSTIQPFSPEVVTPNDPLYPQQWVIPATQVDAVWDSTTGDTTQLIAILDTGVDWLHPDLKNKIWINPGEIPDNGVDDDGNGKVDDVRGWDFVNWDNNPLDDNGHGTHVAGIAGAEGNNGIGISGVSWGAKIIPIKILNSSGSGDANIISQGIYYAGSVGATIINMSFGGYFKSFTMESALMNAVLTSELVAAAGNDSKSIYPKSFSDKNTMYPAAFSFVFGVQVTESFSNFDPDGPVYSTFATGENYELLSYGGGIMSTYPAGKYRYLSGTSMGAPLVSGIIALYNSQKNMATREDRWADFINLSRPVNAFTNIFSTEKKPVFDLRFFELTDTVAAGNDNDNQADAGETIHLWTRIRNTFGKADSTYIKLQLSDMSRPHFEDHITFIKDSAYLGSISSYREQKNQDNPFIFYLKPTFPNEQNLELELLMWDATKTDTSRQTFNISVYNGTELAGLLTGNYILTPDKLWLINNSTRLTTGSTMTILPGTRLIFNGSFDNRGHIDAIGKQDSMIIIENGNLNAAINKYVIFEMGGRSLSGGYFEECLINNSNIVSGDFYKCKFSIGKGIQNAKLENCIINGFDGGLSQGTSLYVGDTLRNCVYENSIFYWNCLHVGFLERNIFRNNVYFSGDDAIFIPNSGIKLRYNIFQGFTNYFVYLHPYFPQYWKRGYIINLSSSNAQFFIGNSFIINRDVKAFQIFNVIGSEDSVWFPNQYFGTTNIQKINEWIFDFNDDATRPFASIYPMMIPPSDSAHGFVWKILVNGKDAQDEVVDPVGVGPQRFDVYFNKPMNPSYTPQLTFGGILPYTAYTVIDSSSWSSDNKIWTAYHNIKLYSGDGINRLRVSGARDLEDFEIPVEDQRFEFLIDAAGSASADFQATAGLGKVNLEWSNPSPTDVPDLLGYNMYRLEHINDTTLTQPVLINTSLINDTLYTDYSITPNEKYYYYYRVVRTDFSESDSSKVVSCIPYTAARGDANGDLSINVLDITSIVNYLLNQNPQPFILEAADVNQDAQVNILDVVGVVNLIMGNPVNKTAEQTLKPKLTFDAKTAYIENSEGLAGLQFKLVGKGISKSGIMVGDAAKNLELSYNITGDTLNVILYSFKNSTLSGGEKGMLFRLTEGYFSELKSVLGSNTRGESVEISLVNDGEIIPKEYRLYQNYPNPFNPVTTIRYALPNQEDVEIRIYNILGQKVWEYTMAEQIPGYYEVKWNSRNSYGLPVSSGIYIYQIKAGKYISQKKMVLLK